MIPYLKKVRSASASPAAQARYTYFVPMVALAPAIILFALAYSAATSFLAFSITLEVE